MLYVDYITYTGFNLSSCNKLIIAVLLQMGSGAIFTSLQLQLQYLIPTHCGLSGQGERACDFRKPYNGKENIVLVAGPPNILQQFL